ncbi:unnamed protein product [Hymenolepis diminuta]|uniref:Uncharacterized protein n=1 Tax=Hymenolepis diminuta TaxID=6216 RepID=A0A564Z322_HYMDI|nr:unnamed protein product [Hymenolepis diminuta]
MMLLKFNRIDHYLCLPHFQPMDSAALTYVQVISKMGSVIGDSSSLFNLIMHEDEYFYHYVDIVD